jgi:hypothetical protein
MNIFHGCNLWYGYQFNYWMKHITWMKLNYEWINLCLQMKLVVCFTLKLSVCFWGLGDLGFRVSLFVLLPRHRCWWRCCCCCFCSPWERAGILLPPIAFVAGHRKRAVAISGLSYKFFNVIVRFCLYLFSSQQKQTDKQNLNICNWCVCLNLFLTDFPSANALSASACFW